MTPSSCWPARTPASAATVGASSDRPLEPGSPYRVVVEGLNIAKRHTKPRPRMNQNDRVPQMQQGGIIEKPMPMAIGKVMLVCPRCDQSDADPPPRAGDWRARPGVRPLRPARGGEGRVSNRLKERYATEVVPALTKQFDYTNPMQVPRLEKIVVNIGLGEALTNAKAVDAAVGDLALITGQKPIVDEGEALDRPVPPADRATPSAPR